MVSSIKVCTRSTYSCCLHQENYPMVGLTLQSASGYLALLEEPNPELQFYALRNIDEIIDQFWPEISDDVVKM